MFSSSVMSAYQPKNQQEIRKINFRQTRIRYFIILLACLVVFGCQYCFDTPSALQTTIQQNYKQGNNNQTLSQSKFNFLYSFYSFPNIVVPLLGGYLIDRIGARVVLVITAILCVVGQTIFSLGGLYNEFSIMIIGRTVFGLGGQVLHASQNTLISNWFNANELSLVLGICISFPKLGSSLNSYVSPLISAKVQNTDENYSNVGIPLFVGGLFMVFSLLLAIILFLLDRKSDLKQKIHHESRILTGQNKERISHRSIRIQQTTSMIGSSQQRNFNYHSFNKTVIQHMSFKDIKQLPITFWLFILVCMLSQSLFIPFLDNGNKYYQQIFIGINNAEDASFYLILPYIVSSIFVLPFGYFFDKIGHRGFVIIGSCVFYVLTYLFMMTLQTSHTLRSQEIVRFIPSFMLGICIALFCTVIVPTVPMLISPRLIGTGFGIMQMLQNLALAMFPIIAGLIRQTQSKQIAGFHIQTLFFFIVSCICLSAAIFLKVSDSLKENQLSVQSFREKYIKKTLINQ